MKLFKKRQKESMMEEYHKASKITDYPLPIDKDREILLEEYAKLAESYKIDSSEETRLRMVDISEQLSPKNLITQKKSLSLFKKKEKFEEKYCHTCKHNISFHHKRGRSTGCRKCGCLRTVEEIMNPTDNGHGKEVVPLLDNNLLAKGEKENGN